MEQEDRPGEKEGEEGEEEEGERRRIGGGKDVLRFCFKPLREHELIIDLLRDLDKLSFEL